MSTIRAAHTGRPAPTAPGPQRRFVLVGLLAALVLGGVVLVRSGPVPTVLLALGTCLGVVLFHSRFGFASAWRQLVAVRQGTALRAQMLMLAVACTLFAPILAGGLGAWGPGIAAATPSLAPIGVGLFVGSFLFGVGMQLGGSCASGTLFAVGSSQGAVLLTLGGFVAGSVLAAWTAPFWAALPAHPPVTLAGTDAGYLGAWLISLAAIAAVVGLTHVVGRGRHVPPVQAPPVARGRSRVWRGSWPLWVGAVLLAVLSAITLLVSGRTWGITFAFALWGSKILDAAGVDVLSWPFWSTPGNLARFESGVLGETTSVMDLGIIVGALVASALAGAWRLHHAVPVRLAIGSVVGGLMMGYGARISSGCNIGAYLGGIASFSLHGWLWGATALAGTALGLRLRPLLGLRNPRPEDSSC